MEKIVFKLFSLDGLGWSFLFFILFFLGSMWFWFSYKRFSYEKIVVKKMDESTFDEFKKEKRVDLYYRDPNNSESSFYWIFGSEDKELKIELRNFRARRKYNSKKSFKNVSIQDKKKIKLEPDEYGALFLSTPSSSSIPNFIVKLELDGLFYTYHISSDMKYGRVGDQRNILKFKQNFRSFIKNRVLQKFD